MLMISEDTLKVAVFQLNMTHDIEQNKHQLMNLISKTSAQDAELWALPECTLFRHQALKDFSHFAMDETIVPWFQDHAKTYKKWILIGSFFYNNPELKGTTNTSVLINPEGTIIQDYNKIHLFDVTIDNLSFLESDRFKAGTTPKTARIKSFLCGFSICFDIRFPELYRLYADLGAQICFIPSSFTKTTGTHHWHTLCRARAIENQCYIIAPNQCGIGTNHAQTYGHSLIVDPFGKILAEASSDTPEVISATLSLKRVTQTRRLFPLLSAKKL